MSQAPPDVGCLMVSPMNLKERRAFEVAEQPMRNAACSTTPRVDARNGNVVVRSVIAAFEQGYG